MAQQIAHGVVTSEEADHPVASRKIIEEDIVLTRKQTEHATEFWKSMKGLQNETMEETEISKMAENIERTTESSTKKTHENKLGLRRKNSIRQQTDRIATSISGVNGLVKDARKELSKKDRLRINQDLSKQRIPIFLFNFTFQPVSKEKTIWDVFVSLWIIYSVYTIPLLIGFEIDLDHSSPMFALNILCDIIFFVDMALTFNTAIHTDYAKDPTDLIYSREGIFWYYIKGWFVVDFVSTFPFDSLPIQGITGSSLRALKIIRTLRLARLLKLSSVLMKLKKLTRSMEETLNINPAIWPLGRLVFLIFSSCHFLSCGWYFCSTYEPVDNWIQAHGVLDKSRWEQYYISFYWTVATMMAVGYGDIHAVTTAEKAYSIFAQVVGAMVFGIIIGTISTIIAEVNPRQVQFSNRMNELKEYMKTRRLPKRLKTQIRRHFKYLWRYQSMFDERGLLNSLSRNLRHKVLIQAYGEVIEAVDILRNNESNTRFVEIVVTQAKPYLALTGDILAVSGKSCHDMFLVRKGRVSGMIDLQKHVDMSSLSYEHEVSAIDIKHRPSTVVKHPEVVSLTASGGMFGNESLLSDQYTNILDYCALSICDLLTLSKAALQILHKKCPDMYVTMRTDATEKFKLIEAEVSHYAKNGERLVFFQNDVCYHTLEEHFGEIVKNSKVIIDKVARGSTASQTSHAGFSKHDSFRTIQPAVVRRGSLASLAPIEDIDMDSERQSAQDKIEMLYDTRLYENAVEGEDTGHMLSSRWIIHPVHPMKMLWDVGVGILIMYSVVSIPVTLCFYGNIDDPDSSVADLFAIAVDLIFFTDMIVCFRTAYYDESQTFLITVPRMIRDNYLKGWFVIDFLSTVPLDRLVMAAMEGSGGTELRSIKLIRAIRLFRLIKMVRLLKMGKLTESIQDVLDFSPAFFRLISLLLEVTAIAHMAACFWWMFGWLNSYEDSWYGNLDNRPFLEQYLTSIYWAFTTMTTVGYGDITPKNRDEYLFASFMMVIGATVFGYVVGNVSRMMGSLNVGKKRKKDSLRNVKNYLRERKVAKPLQRRVMQFFENILEERTAFDEMQILSDLPEHIRTDVLLHVHKSTIPLVCIFKDQSKSFIGTMLTILRPQHVAARDFIYHEGENGFDMYFLVRGECVSGYYLGNVLSEMKMQVYLPGSFFGEGALIQQTHRKVAVMAEVDSYILALARSDVEWLISTYPHWATSFLNGMKAHFYEKNKIKGWGGLKHKLRGKLIRKKMKASFMNTELLEEEKDAANTPTSTPSKKYAVQLKPLGES
jgi:CRP-like cAMP-binding protein